MNNTHLYIFSGSILTTLVLLFVALLIGGFGKGGCFGIVDCVEVR